MEEPGVLEHGHCVHLVLVDTTLSTLRRTVRLPQDLGHSSQQVRDDSNSQYVSIYKRHVDIDRLKFKTPEQKV